MRFPLRGAAFFLTVGVVQHTTPVALHLGQLPGGGTGSHLSRRILQQSHAGSLLRLVPAPFVVVVVVGVAEEAGVPLVVSVCPAGGDEVCDMAVGALSELQLCHVESAWRTYNACLCSDRAAAEPQQDFPRPKGAAIEPDSPATRRSGSGCPYNCQIDSLLASWCLSRPAMAMQRWQEEPANFGRLKVECLAGSARTRSREVGSWLLDSRMNLISYQTGAGSAGKCVQRERVRADVSRACALSGAD